MKTVDVGYSNFVLASEIIAILDVPYPDGETNLVDHATVPAFTFNNRCLIQWGKPLENRKWKPASFPMGVYIALHRGKGYDLQGAQWLIDHREALGLAPDTIIPAKQKESGIIAVCRLTDVVTESASPWFFGPYGWCLADIVPIPLVPCAGALSLWELPPDVLEAVRKAYAVAVKPKPKIDHPPATNCICPTPSDAQMCIELRYGSNEECEECSCHCHADWDTWLEDDEDRYP